DQQEQSPTPALVGDPVPHPSRQLRRGPSLEPTNSLQPRLQAGRQAPDDLFHEPEHSPENRHTRGPLPGHRSDHATVTGTPSKRYKPINARIPVTFAVVLLALALTGALSAYLGGAMEPSRDPFGCGWVPEGSAPQMTTTHPGRAVQRNGSPAT
ncbi:MAG TPA: hypothetical protein VF086_06760, partial [Propionibacteriaceae bacterium]